MSEIDIEIEVLIRKVEKRIIQNANSLAVETVMAKSRVTGKDSQEEWLTGHGDKLTYSHHEMLDSFKGE